MCNKPEHMAYIRYVFFFYSSMFICFLYLCVSCTI